jgi:hypothetical protein
MRYFVVQYARTPKGKVDEQVGIIKNLRPKDYQNFSVIMDFKEKRVIKARIEDKVVDKDWDKLIETYAKYYKDGLNQIEQIWRPGAEPILPTGQITIA